MRPTILKGCVRVVFALLVGSVVLPAFAAVSSDLASPQKRQATVRLAELLTRISDRAPMASMQSPFSPAGFDGPPSGEIAPNREGDVYAVPNAQPPPASDRSILELLSARIPSTGTLARDGKMMLTVGPKRIEAGQVLVVADGVKEYEFEVVAITSTTFTLRFRNEEITRPVHSIR
jgi:hypothetical protein